MLIRFATCDRQSALCFLKKFYPNSTVEDAPESAGAVLDMVAKDIIRIPDPERHGGTIYPSKNWPDDADEQASIVAVLDRFHKSTIETKRSGS